MGPAQEQENNLLGCGNCQYSNVERRHFGEHVVGYQLSCFTFAQAMAKHQAIVRQEYYGPSPANLRFLSFLQTVPTSATDFLIECTLGAETFLIVALIKCVIQSK